MKSISLFYWSNLKLQGWETENYGDLLSCYLVERISGKKVKWVHPKKMKWFQKKKHYLAIGSILAHATKNSEVWGSGIITKDQEVAPAKFHAVRGPETRKQLLKQNIECPEVYGDPGLLLPRFFAPPITKTRVLGWVPHYADIDFIKKVDLPKNNAFIDLRTDNIEQVTMQLLSCERILSSSLHGLIVAHAYGIPALWVKFSDNLFGDDIKFKDYFKSVGIEPYDGIVLEDLALIASAKAISTIFESVDSEQQVPDSKRIQKIQDQLLRVCPFKQ